MIRVKTVSPFAAHPAIFSNHTHECDGAYRFSETVVCHFSSLDRAVGYLPNIGQPLSQLREAVQADHSYSTFLLPKLNRLLIFHLELGGLFIFDTTKRSVGKHPFEGKINLRLFSETLSTEIPKVLREQWTSLFYNGVQDLKGIRELFLSIYPPFRQWASKTPPLGTDSQWQVSIDYQGFPFPENYRSKFRNAWLDNKVSDAEKVIRETVFKHNCAIETIQFQDINRQNAPRMTEIRDIVNIDATDEEKERYQNVTVDTWMTWTEAKKRLKPLFIGEELEKRDGRKTGSIIVDPNKDLDIFVRWLCGDNDEAIAIDIYGCKNYETDKKNVYSKIKKFRKLIDPNNLSSSWNP